MADNDLCSKLSKYAETAIVEAVLEHLESHQLVPLPNPRDGCINGCPVATHWIPDGSGGLVGCCDSCEEVI